jgi:Icc-related predicted phosphoesterase
MRIVAISDIHGRLPKLPDADLCILAGDLCPTRDHSIEFQSEWLDTDFRLWLENIPARKIIGIAGNHDFVFEQRSDLVPRDLPWICLQDSGIEFEGLRLWGTPWTPMFFNWAFMESERELETRFADIPDGLDILISHGPPWGVGDKNIEGGLCGSRALKCRVELTKPRFCVFGHIHEGRGEYILHETRCLNVSHLDHRYRPYQNPVTVIDL